MENLNKAIIAEITGLAIDIQNAKVGTVFIDLHGEALRLYIRVYLGNYNWASPKGPDFSIDVNLSNEVYISAVSPAEAIAQLTALLNPVTA